MKKGQIRGSKTSGTLLLELMIVVALTVFVSSSGFRVIAVQSESLGKLDKQCEVLQNFESSDWTSESEERIEINGQVMAVTVMQRKW